MVCYEILERRQYILGWLNLGSVSRISGFETHEPEPERTYYREVPIRVVERRRPPRITERATRSCHAWLLSWYDNSNNDVISNDINQEETQSTSEARTPTLSCYSIVKRRNCNPRRNN
ncbi:hypothetical protein C0J52_10440 [Blattella germanica]|nr:hypothetical protein C0J52_10440 [Blattella germanica]PSN37959.1 hypothetical protein C0J52_10440 [Blattella germanica]